jgi:predicted permease
MGLVLLVGALLFVRTLQGLTAVHLGFDPAGVTAFTTDSRNLGYTAEQTDAYWNEFTRRLDAVPGFQSVALAALVPFGGLRYRANIRSAKSQGSPVFAWTNYVSPEYFVTLRIALVRGIGFVPADSAQDVVVLSQTLAERLFGSGDPLGRRVELDGQGRRVIGVAADSHGYSLDQDPEPFVYQPFHDPGNDRLVIVRSSLDARKTAAAIQHIGAELDGSLPIGRIRLITDGIANYLSERLLFAKVLSLLTVIALGLAGAGLYGLVAFGVAFRTREFGIRMALGAEGSSILRLVLQEGAVLAGLGIAFGLGGAVLAARVIKTQLYGVDALDPVTYLVAAASLGLLAILATLRPARAATRVDPASALRYE